MSHSDPDFTPVAPEASDEPASPDAAQEQPTDPVTPDAPLGDGDNAVGATPPGFDWPTHGGYLGCLIGCLAAFLIGGFLGSVLLGTLYVVGGGTAITMAVVALIVYAAVAYGLCRLGWTLGKRYYRSYQEPGDTTWGEHDEFAYSEDAETDQPSAARVVDVEGAVDLVDEPANGAATESALAEEEEAHTGLPLSSDGKRG